MQGFYGFLVFIAFAFTCGATTYNCSTINAPGTPTGINNSGMIVGTTASGGHGYVRDAAGNITLVDYPGASATQLFTINNNGVSVGFAGNGSPASVIFTRDLSGGFTAIPTSAYTSGFFMNAVYGINDAGAMSGMNGSSFFILNPDGSTIPVPSPSSGPGLAPGSINNSPLMLETAPLFGSAADAALGGPGLQPTLIYSNDPSGSGPHVFGLNNPGTVVGFVGHYLKSSPFGPPWTGFTQDSSGIQSSLVCTGLSNIQPFAINDSGIVTGVYGQATTPEYFLATPVPGSAQFNASVSSLDFGQVPYGQTSAPLTFVISNSGNTRMDIGGVRLRGVLSLETSPSFAASACMSQGAAVVSLNPGQSCIVSVTAVPSNPFPAPPNTQESDILLIDDSAPNSPHQIPVTAFVAGGTPPPPAPSCLVSPLNPGPPRQLTFTIQDTISGLQSITLVDSTNAAPLIPTFTSGTTSAVLVQMVELDQQQNSRVDLKVTNTAGLSTSCGADIAGGANQWGGLNVSFAGKVTVVNNSSGGLEAFVRAENGNLLHSSESAPGGSWSAWENLGGVIVSDPAVSLNSLQGLDVFAAGTDHAVWYIAQTGPGSTWSNWTSTGGSVVGNPSVILNLAGDLEVFARGDDSTLLYNTQVQPGGSWAGWISLGGYLLSSPVSAIKNDGVVELFALGGDHGLWQIDQTGIQSWTQWKSVGPGTFIGSPAIVVDPAGRLDVFLQGGDNSLWQNVQSSGDDQAWTGWNWLGGYLTSDPAAALNRSGVVEVFGRGGDNALWHKVQTSPGGVFGGWMSLGGVLADDVSAVIDSSGRVEVYARAPDGTLWGIAQVYPGDWN